MQKLVKRRMHYETIMPVEAYEDEDNTIWEEIYFWGLTSNTTATSIALGTMIGGPAGTFVGTTLGVGVAVVDHYFHDEMVDALQVMGEGMAQQQLHNMEVQQAMGDMISDGAQAVVDTIVEGIEALGDYESDTPVASGPLQPVH